MITVAAPSSFALILPMIDLHTSILRAVRIQLHSGAKRNSHVHVGLVTVKALAIFSFKRVVGKPTECFFWRPLTSKPTFFFLFIFPPHVERIQDTQNRAKAQHTNRRDRLLLVACMPSATHTAYRALCQTKEPTSNQ